MSEKSAFPIQLRDDPGQFDWGLTQRQYYKAQVAAVMVGRYAVGQFKVKDSEQIARASGAMADALLAEDLEHEVELNEPDQD